MSNNDWARRAARAGAVGLLPLAIIGSIAAARVTGTHHDSYKVPVSSSMEAKTGVRISAVKVVGDNGLVQIDYVVLDSEKASQFQNDVKNPPHIEDGKHRKNGVVWRAALMKQGHTLRSGQTYYILYQNQNNTVRKGDNVTLTYGGVSFPSVPVR